MSRGCFITLEGSEGAGKSTNLAFVCERLEAWGLPVVRTREPGGTPFAEEIRALLLATRDEPVAPLAELLLMFASRAQHVAQLIEPELAAGNWVVCDRFTDATYAYQGAGRRLGEESVDTLARLVHPGLSPNLTLYLDIPWEASVARLSDRERDRMEQESRDFFERVRSSYLALAASQPRFVVVDATRALPAVQADISEALQQLMTHRLGQQ